MSNNDIIDARVAELAAFVEAGKQLTSEKKNEFAAKWNISLRMVERYIKKVWNRIADKTETAKKTAVNEMETAAEIMHGNIVAAVSKLCAIANGEYESEKIVYAHNEPKIINCKPSVKEQLQAMKLLKEYEELFVTIKKTMRKRLIKCLKCCRKEKQIAPPIKNYKNDTFK